MRIIARALIVFIALVLALSVVKFLFVKLFFLACSLGMILLVGFVIYSLLKRA
ncbi:MAG TPA: hypothetical protein VFG11_09255 [Acidobacteriota bacterium]|nr:hypothetical protein [Acidobacteriota bacterium]